MITWVRRELGRRAAAGWRALRHAQRFDPRAIREQRAETPAEREARVFLILVRYVALQMLGHRSHEKIATGLAAQAKRLGLRW